MGCEQFFADVSRKIIALADPVLSQADMKREMVSPPAGAYIRSFTIYHVLPDLPGQWQEGPATHLCPVLFVCRSYEKKPENAGPPSMSLLLSDRVK